MIIITPYNVLAADCLPVQIGDNYENKGNQKHLTFEQRVDIEKGLTENKSFTEIGRIIGKNPSTISKEVRLHAHTKERPDSGYTHPPCIHRKNCKVTCLCDKMCGIHCKLCRKPSFRCTDICPAYETAECEKLNKPPTYVMAVVKDPLSYAQKVLFIQICP